MTVLYVFAGGGALCGRAPSPKALQWNDLKGAMTFSLDILADLVVDDSGRCPLSIFCSRGTPSSITERQGQNLAMTVLYVPYSLEEEHLATVFIPQGEPLYLISQNIFTNQF